jgi:hypothetical protein
MPSLIRQVAAVRAASSARAHYDQTTIFHLALDANLHIVDQHGEAPWLADVLKRAWNVNAEGSVS